MPSYSQDISPLRQASSGPPAGAVAPEFTLQTSSGRSVSLCEQRGKPVMLAFYPPNWDPSRLSEVVQFQQAAQSLRDTGATIVGITMDTSWCRVASADPRIEFPVLADLSPPGGVARAYGAYGRQALFLVDADGVIRWSYVAPPGTTPRAETVLEGLEALAPAPDDPTQSSAPWKVPISRREFVAGALAAAFAIAVWPVARPARAQSPASGAPAAGTGQTLSLQVNGVAHTIPIEPRVTLLDALRERIGLTGSKKGCDHGQCGACTVIIDGRRELSCLTLAMAAAGSQITTIEGLAEGDQLHPMQQAFIDHDGFQCGYCTPGQIMSAVALLKENIGPADSDVREHMSGNICRCGAYPNIVAAIQSVRNGGSGNASV